MKTTITLLLILIASVSMGQKVGIDTTDFNIRFRVQSEFEYVEAIRISESDTTAHIINGSTRVITEKDIKDYYDWCNENYKADTTWIFRTWGYAITTGGTKITLEYFEEMIKDGRVKHTKDGFMYTILRAESITPSFDGFYKWLKEK